MAVTLVLPCLIVCDRVHTCLFEVLSECYVVTEALHIGTICLFVFYDHVLSAL